MLSLNKVMLIGNITRDIDLRFTPSGLAIAEFGIAVNRRVKDGQDETAFIDISIWGKSAEACKKYLSKGDPVYVEGRLTYETWEDRNGGGKRSRLKVTAENVQFMGNSKKDEDQGLDDGNYGRGKDKANTASNKPPTRKTEQKPPQNKSGGVNEDDSAF